MPVNEQSDLVAALATVPDPRRQCKNLRHPLVDVLVLGFCGVLCGCEDFVELATFGRKKEDFFRRFLELPEGIPSHDTFRDTRRQSLLCAGSGEAIPAREVDR